MHLGLILPNYGDRLTAERLAAVAVAAEESGFDSGWATDHLIVPGKHAPIYGSIAEPLLSLAFLAARTERLQLGVSALIVPVRQPLVALKELTTLDLLSGGRIVTAVAAGWMEGEFETLGAPFEQRGKLLDDWLDLAASAFAQMRSIASSDWSGNCPIAVSAESITASAPSSTAFATSLASARVGRGAPVMLSSICVATITNLPAAVARRTRSF